MHVHVNVHDFKDFGTVPTNSTNIEQMADV